MAAITGIVVTAIGIAVSLTIPEIRNLVGLQDRPANTAPAGPTKGATGTQSSGTKQFNSTDDRDQPAPPTRRIVAIDLPQVVYDFTSEMNPTRQSYIVDQTDIGSGAYDYSYWEDPASIWLDATVVSGADGLAALRSTVQQRMKDSQHSERYGTFTCWWPHDADPNTPRHGAFCSRIDEQRILGLVTRTHTQNVGDINAYNLASEVWNTMEVVTE